MSKNCGGPYGDDVKPAADTDMQASSDASGEWVSVYAVPKMDCPSEERMICLLYTSPSPRDGLLSRMPSSA